jgi:hypothetical protein
MTKRERERDHLSIPFPNFPECLRQLTNVQGILTLE